MKPRLSSSHILILAFVLLTAGLTRFATAELLASTGSLNWIDLGEAASGESAVGPLVSTQGKVIGGTYGSGAPHVFKYDITGSAFSPKISVPGTGAHVSRLALGLGNQIYVSTSRTSGQGNLASYDPQTDVTLDLGSVGDEYGEALAVGLDGKVYVATCCQGQFSIYDPQTQSWTRKGRIITNQIRHSGLAAGSDGNIYGVTSRIWIYPYGSAVLYKYNVISQTTAVIGTIWPGTHESWNIVSNPMDGRLYGSVGYGMDARLFVYDPANPQLGIVDLGIAVSGEDIIGAGALAIASDGKVYAATSPNAHLVVYDPLNPSSGISDLGPGYGNLAFGTDGNLYGTSGTHLVRLAFGPTYAISGHVTDAKGSPIDGAIVAAGTGGSATTDGSGYYTLSGLSAGTYTLTPSKNGYSFSPPRPTINVSGNVTGQDFRGIVAAPFLDLPFDYGGTDGSFVTALYDTDHGGRVDSWFDHDLPTYYPKNQRLLLYDGRARTQQLYNSTLGCYEGRCYDGHNGFDFSYVDPLPGLLADPLPVYPAAGGVATSVASACSSACRYGSCKLCGSYGNFVVIDHQNGFFTRYAHLNQVYVTNSQTVTVNDTLGMMGNSGNVAVGDGTHLHFSVHLDSNGNGQWDEESTDKPLDPCGYMGESDPWTVHGGPISTLLWQHACTPGQQAVVSANQGAIMTDVTGQTTAEVPTGALTGSAMLELSPGPVAGASAQLRSTGSSFWLRLLEWLPESNSQVQAAALPDSIGAFGLTQPVTLTVAYSKTAVSHIDISQLALHIWDENEGAWQPLPTEVDPINRVITATSQYLGDFDLQAPLLCATDDFEPDDGYPSAVPLWPNDSPLARGLDIMQDADWVRFHAAQGGTYTIRTHDLAGGADTVLNLYDTDGLTVLVSNDDTGGNPASELTWIAPYTGTYFVQITSAPVGTTDCTATYQLSITTTFGLAVTITRAVDGAKLTWPHDSMYPNYQVRRGTTPFFTANGWSELSADVPAPEFDITASFTDVDAFATAGTSYFYAVIPTDADRAPYLVSTRVGVFNFSLTPGISP